MLRMIQVPILGLVDSLATSRLKPAAFPHPQSQAQITGSALSGSSHRHAPMLCHEPLSQCDCKANLFNKCFPSVFGGSSMLSVTVVLLPSFKYQDHSTQRSSFSPMPKKHFRNSLKECNTEAMILEQYLLVTNRVRTIPPGWEEACKSRILVGQTGWKKHRSEAFTDTVGLNSGREERTAQWAGEMAQRIKTLLSNLRI